MRYGGSCGAAGRDGFVGTGLRACPTDLCVRPLAGIYLHNDYRMIKHGERKGQTHRSAPTPPSAAIQGEVVWRPVVHRRPRLRANAGGGPSSGPPHTYMRPMAGGEKRPGRIYATPTPPRPADRRHSGEIIGAFGFKRERNVSVEKVPERVKATPLKGKPRKGNPPYPPLSGVKTDRRGRFCKPMCFSSMAYANARSSLAFDP